MTVPAPLISLLGDLFQALTMPTCICADDPYSTLLHLPTALPPSVANTPPWRTPALALQPQPLQIHAYIVTAAALTILMRELVPSARFAPVMTLATSESDLYCATGGNPSGESARRREPLPRPHALRGAAILLEWQ